MRWQEGCNHITIKFPELLGGQPTNWKRIAPQKFSHGSKNSEPHVRFSNLMAWQWEEETQENLALKARRVGQQGFHGIGGNRNSTPGWHTEGLRHTRIQGEKAVTS